MKTIQVLGPMHTPARLPGFEPGHPGVKDLCLHRLTIAHCFCAILHGASDIGTSEKHFLFPDLFRALAYIIRK